MATDPNRPLVPPVLPRAPASGKSQHAPKLEEPAQEESSPAPEQVGPTREVSQLAVDIEKSMVPGRSVPTKKKRALAQSSRLSHIGVMS